MEMRQKLGALVGLSCGMLLGLLIGVSVSSSREISGLVRTRSVAIREQSSPAEHPARLQADIHALHRQAKDLLLRTDSPEKVASARERWDEQRTLVGVRLAALEASATRPDEMGLAKALRMELAAYDAAVRKILALIEDGTIKTSRGGQKALSAQRSSTRS
jgi:hypothetical protein